MARIHRYTVDVIVRATVTLSDREGETSEARASLVARRCVRARLAGEGAQKRDMERTDFGTGDPIGVEWVRTEVTREPPGTS